MKIVQYCYLSCMHLLNIITVGPCPFFQLLERPSIEGLSHATSPWYSSSTILADTPIFKAKIKEVWDFLFGCMYIMALKDLLHIVWHHLLGYE